MKNKKIIWEKRDGFCGKQTTYTSSCGRFVIYKGGRLGMLPDLFVDGIFHRGYKKISDAKAEAQRITSEPIL